MSLWALLRSVFGAQVTTLCCSPAEPLTCTAAAVRWGAAGSPLGTAGLQRADEADTVGRAVGCGSECPEQLCCRVWALGSLQLQLCEPRERDRAALVWPQLALSLRSPAVPTDTGRPRRSAARFGVTEESRSPALPGGISRALFDCSPRTRRCWRVWVTSSRSCSKPRRPPQRSYRESHPCHPPSGRALGPGVVFVCQGQRHLSHPSDVNSSEQNLTRTADILLQIGVRGLTPFPQPHRSRQLWYFGKGQC